MFNNITVKYKLFNIVNVYKILGTILPNFVTIWAIKKPRIIKKKMKKTVKKKKIMIHTFKAKLEVFAKNAKNFYNRRYLYNHGKLYFKRKPTNIFVTLHTYLKGLVKKYWSSGTAGYRGRSRRKELAHVAISKLIARIIVKKNLRDIHMFLFNKWNYMYRKHMLPYLTTQRVKKKIKFRTINLILRISHGFIRRRALPHKKWTSMRYIKK